MGEQEFTLNNELPRQLGLQKQLDFKIPNMDEITGRLIFTLVDLGYAEFRIDEKTGKEIIEWKSNVSNVNKREILKNLQTLCGVFQEIIMKSYVQVARFYNDAINSQISFDVANVNVDENIKDILKGVLKVKNEIRTIFRNILDLESKYNEVMSFLTFGTPSEEYDFLKKYVLGRINETLKKMDSYIRRNSQGLEKFWTGCISKGLLEGLFNYYNWKYIKVKLDEDSNTPEEERPKLESEEKIFEQKMKIVSPFTEKEYNKKPYIMEKEHQFKVEYTKKFLIYACFSKSSELTEEDMKRYGLEDVEKYDEVKSLIKRRFKDIFLKIMGRIHYISECENSILKDAFRRFKESYIPSPAKVYQDYNINLVQINMDEWKFIEIEENNNGTSTQKYEYLQERIDKIKKLLDRPIINLEKL